MMYNFTAINVTFYYLDKVREVKGFLIRSLFLFQVVTESRLKILKWKVQKASLSWS